MVRVPLIFSNEYSAQENHCAIILVICVYVILMHLCWKIVVSVCEKSAALKKCKYLTIRKMTVEMEKNGILIIIFFEFFKSRIIFPNF